MDDDFEISRALAAIFNVINLHYPRLNDGETTREEAQLLYGFLQRIDCVLAVFEQKEDVLPVDVEKLIAERNAARADKNFVRADEIRQQLLAQEIILEDTPIGTVWKKAL